MHEKGLAKDVAEDVLGAAKDGNVKLLIVEVLIFPNVICQIVKVFIIVLSKMSKTFFCRSQQGISFRRMNP